MNNHTRAIKEMLKIIPMPQVGKGGKYYNAIDEDHYDPTDWPNGMPSNGYIFDIDEETGECTVTYEYSFACWDGWDSMTTNHGTFNTYYDAVEAIYSQIMYEQMIDRMTIKLRKFQDIALDNWRKEAKIKGGSADTSILCLFTNELHRYNLWE